MSETIQSFSNPRIKQTLKLRDASQRRKRQKFLIDGPREIELAVQRGIEIECIFFADALPTAGQPHLWQQVSLPILERLSYGQRAAGHVAVAHTPALGLEELQFDPSALILVLDRIEKPGNLGACLRTAAAIGVDAIVATDPVCEVFNPNTIRSSRGTVFTQPIAVATSMELRQRLKSQSIPIFSARVDGVTGLWECDFKQGCALVFGNEAEGLGTNWSGPEIQAFQIPMKHDHADSLNISISAAVTLYEAARQRHQAASAPNIAS